MIYKLLVLAALLILVSCGNEISGGSDNPDFIAGVVLDSSGSPVSNVQIQCIPKNYHPTVKETNSPPSAETDAQGTFSFRTEPGTYYTIEAYYSAEQQAILSNLTSSSDTTLTLQAPGILSVELPSSLVGNRVVIALPGTSFIDTLPATVLNDTIVAIKIAALPAGSYGNTLLIDGIQYSLSSTLSIEAAEETTLSVKEMSNTVKPVWEFPLIIGVQEETMDHYGGIQAFRTLLVTQLAQAEEAFNDQRIKGILRLRVDSIYSYSGSFNEENSQLSDSIALRILYDAKSKSDIGNWNKKTRTIFHDHTEHSSDSLFSAGSLRQLMFELGLWRGCYYRSAMEVYSGNNPISYQAYEPSPTIMQQRSRTLWSDFSTELINHYGPNYSIEPDTIKFSSADTLQFSVTDTEGKPISGAAITLYGVAPHSLAVNTAATFHLTTDQQGKAQLTTGLFKGDKISIQSYSNALIVVTVENKSSYSWFPFEEVGLYYQQTKETRYTKNLLFQ